MNFKFDRIPKGLGSKEMWKTLGFTLLGGAGGEILGAAIQGISGRRPDGSYRIDLSGWTGDLVTGGLVAAIGLGFDRPAVAVGTLAVKGMKQVYLHGNPILARTVGSPIPPVRKDDNILNSAQASTVNDVINSGDMLAAPAGMQFITRPDGTKVLVSNGSAGETVNDYSVTPLSEYATSPLSEYATSPLSEYATSPLSEYAGNPFGSFSLNDEFSEDFAEQIANGNFN